MTTDTIAQMALGLAITTVTGLVGLHYRQMKDAKEQAREHGELKLKVDTMWEFQMRRGMSEARMNDVLRRNSPLKLTDRTREALTPLRDGLHAFYQSITGEILNEMEEFIAVERRFGEVLAEDVCPIINASNGACVWAAMLYGRELMNGNGHGNSTVCDA